MNPPGHDRTRVFQGIVIAWIISAVFIVGGYSLVQHLGWFAAWSSDRVLALTLLPPAISVVMGIGWAARTRYFVQNIDGSAPTIGTPLDITLRYTTNTVEQAVLFLISVLIFLGASPQMSQGLLPIMGLWFLISRGLFWVGYAKAPQLRAVGFASTFHPTVALLLLCALIFVFGLRL
jgi:hypothetical protein